MNSLFWITAYLSGCIIMWIIALDAVRTKTWKLETNLDLVKILCGVFLGWISIAVSILWCGIVLPARVMLDTLKKNKEKDDKD